MPPRPPFRGPSWPRNPFRSQAAGPPLPALPSPEPFQDPDPFPTAEGGEFPPGDGPPGSIPPGGGPPGDGLPESGGHEEGAPAGNPLIRRRVTLPRSTRVWSRAIVWSLIAITTGGTIYGLIAQIESSVAAPGKLRPIGGIAELSPPMNGLVQQVLVKNGQRVRRGQALLRLRDDAGSEVVRNLESIQQQWVEEVSSLARQLNLGPMPRDPSALALLVADTRELELRQQASQRDLLRAEIQARQQLSDLQGLRSQLRANQDISARMRSLVQKGAMAKLDLDRQLERQEQVNTAMRRTEYEWASAVQRVEETRLRSLQIPAAELRQTYSRFNNARQQLIEVTSKIAEQRQRMAFQVVTAPIDGKVSDLKARVGEMASPASTVMKIIPESKLEVSLDVSNRDIGFLRKGMKVDIRIDSFPSTEYGSIKGWITVISDDTLPPDEQNPRERFAVTVKMAKQVMTRHGVNYHLRPGMSVTGLIIMDSRPAITLITDRFNRFFESSRTIR
jgi:hemolysin D